MRSRMPCAVLSVCLAVVLAGCSSGDGGEGPSSPTSSSTTSSRPSSSSSSTSAEPELEVPEAATKHTPEGAEAFATFFLEDVITEAWTTPKTGLIPQYSAKECKSCASLEETAGQLTEQDHHYASAPGQVADVAVSEGAPPGLRAVMVVSIQRDVDVIDRDGEIVRSFERAERTTQVWLEWKDGQWLVNAIA